MLFRSWSDEKDNIFAMEKGNPERYGQRVTDVAVVETGKNLGVKTYIVVPPTICELADSSQIEYHTHNQQTGRDPVRSQL